MEWRTAAEVIAAKDALEASMPGWRQPAAYGLGQREVGQREEGRIEWRVVNHPNRHHLPAAVLGRVLGHRSGNASYALTDAQLDEAIDLLKPAEACTEFQHPNLWGWEALRSERRTTSDSARGGLVVVFLDDPGSATDEVQASLTEFLAQRGAVSH